MKQTPSLHPHSCHPFSPHFTARNLDKNCLMYLSPICLPPTHSSTHCSLISGPIIPVKHALNLIDVFHSLSCWMSHQHLTLLTIASFMENSLPLASAKFLGKTLFCRLTLLSSVIQCRCSLGLCPPGCFLARQSLLSPVSTTVYMSMIFSILLPVQTCFLNSRSVCQTI